MQASGPGSAVDDFPQPGEVIGGRYRIERRLGSGATGVVYEASHEITGRVVALKWLRPDLAASEAVAARFLREARAAATIDHPRVVAVLDAGRERGTIFLAMERLEGESFAEFLARGPHPPARILGELMPALRGVAAAHARGIVHRDLKPDNVFLARPRPGWPGGAKVLDFGISKLREPVDGRELTAAGVLLGSPLYMAPEQILNSSAVDARSDVYAIGVMLYEAIAGVVPYEAETMHDLFRKVIAGNVRPIRAHRPDVPEALEEVVLRAMARRPDDRYPSVRELALALEPFAGGVRFDDDESGRGPPPAQRTAEGDVSELAHDSSLTDTDPRGMTVSVLSQAPGDGARTEISIALPERSGTSRQLRGWDSGQAIGASSRTAPPARVRRIHHQALGVALLALGAFAGFLAGLVVGLAL